jgi:CheY-like chemotaxis protein
LNILLVEDNEDTRDVFVLALTVEGYSVTATSTRDEAFRLLKEGHCFDIVLLDYNLPGMSIEEFLSGVKTKCPTLPIVLSTATASIESLSKSLGLKWFIQKPYDPQRFVLLAHEILKSDSR